MITGLMQVASTAAGFGQVGTMYTLPGGSVEPSKSAIIGMLAAALGRKKTDSIDDLNSLKLGIAVINPGLTHHHMGVSFGVRAIDRSDKKVHTQTSIRKNPLIRKRSYQYAGLNSDVGHLVRYVIAFEGEPELVKQVLAALVKPVFAVFIGRKACTPAEPMAIGTFDGNLKAALKLIKVPCTATIECTPKDRLPNSSRRLDVLDSFSSRGILSRMVARVQLNG